MVSCLLRAMASSASGSAESGWSSTKATSRGTNNTLNTQLHRSNQREKRPQLTQLHPNPFPCERKLMPETGPSRPSPSWTHERLQEKRQREDGRGAKGGTRQSFRPTHSSSTCFIRRDTLPASLVTRVLHRGAQQKHARISGLIHGDGRRRLRWVL